MKFIFHYFVNFIVITVNAQQGPIGSTPKTQKWNIFINENRNELYCSTEDNFLASNITWFNANGKHIENDSNFNIKDKQWMSALASKDKRFRFNGTYKCEANVRGKKIATAKVILSSVENYALFENCPEEITVIQDRNESVLLCYVSDHKLFRISVIKFGMRSFQKPMYSFSDEINASSRYPKTGEDFSLSCNYSGNSMAIVKWQYPSKQSNVIVKRTTLMFKKLSKSNEGLYNCLVSKESGNLSRSYRIFVSRDPAIIRFGNVTERDGTETKLACMAIGDILPLTTIRRFDGASISSS
ncbi:hypothetical protein B4U80_13409 [Leptotrombidium deliense]|uniref:Ig-like domain-containing protein n=1 Tax=Leptotrombidium deliense TaxID=299467 RepID=A0A443S742_9ACAR|nr:hypothetical protein B4U80_13409 [Leptotrombidium deliense]